jgi:hypothetical protein
MGTLTLVQAVADATTPVALNTINAGSAPDDWALWDGSITPAQRKSGGGSTISSALFGGGVENTTVDARTITWTGGTPTASGSSADCIFNTSFSPGTGFTLTMPADTTLRRLWVLCGPYNTGAEVITASLSDSSATAINYTTFTGSGATFNPFLVIIDFAANGSATLTVTFKTGAASSDTITLQAAAVAVSSGGGDVLSAQSVF